MSFSGVAAERLEEILGNAFNTRAIRILFGDERNSNVKWDYILLLGMVALQ